MVPSIILARTREVVRAKADFPHRLVDDNLAYAKFHRSPKLHFKGTQLGQIYVTNNLIGL